MKTLVLIYIAFFSSTAFSQTNSDFAYINYATIPKADFDKREGSAALTNLEANLITPTITLSNKLKINNIINYRYCHYVYNNSSNHLVPLPEKLQEFRYTILLRNQLTSKWGLLAVPRLSIRGDFKENLSNNDLFPSLAIVAIKTSQKIPTLKWGFGLNYNNDFAKNTLLPVLFFEYTRPALRINAFLPSNASISFLSIKKVEYGFGYNSDAVIYHTRIANIGNPNIAYLRTLNIYINPTFSYNVASKLWLNLKTGMVLSRVYDFYNNNFESTSEEHKNSLKATPFAQIGISLRQ